MAKDEVRETHHILIEGPQRFVLTLHIIGYVYYVACDQFEVAGEGFSIEEAATHFYQRLEEYNLYGP